MKYIRHKKESGHTSLLSVRYIFIATDVSERQSHNSMAFIWAYGEFSLRGLNTPGPEVIINVKKIAFGSKEHTRDKKMGVSVFIETLHKQ